MKFHELSFDQLYFPKTEWSWLRADARYDESPDAFLWAAPVDGKLWAWHPKGAGVLNGFAGLKVRVIEIAADGTEIAAFGAFLKTSFDAVNPQEVEWVNALTVLEERLDWELATQGLPPLWREALQCAGYEPHLGPLAQRSKFKFLTYAERKLLFQKKWDPSFFELAETLAPPARQALAAAVAQYNISANHAKELINQALILVRKYGEKAAADVFAKTHKSGDELRTSVFKLAQPELSRLSDARIDKLRGLRLPPRTSVYGDPSFEKDLLKVTHTPRSPSDWEAFRDWVNRQETADKIADLLDLYQ